MTWTTRIDRPLRVVFSATAGLVSGQFDAVLVDPSGATSTPVTVLTTAIAGIYAAPIAANVWSEPGTYAFVVSAPSLRIVEAIEVVDDGGDVRVSMTHDAASNLVRAHAWLTLDLGQVSVGVANATLRLYDRTGTALAALQTAAQADAQGVFAFNFAAPAFVVGEHATYVVCSVDRAGRTYRSVTGVTFSRTS